MSRTKVAVLIIESEGKSTKSIQIPSFVLTHWKKIVISLISMMVLVFFCMVYLVRSHTSEHYSATYGTRIQELQKQNKKLATAEEYQQETAQEMKKSLHAIDSTLMRINKKMKSRGLQEIKLKNMGGPIEKEDNVTELSMFYDKQLKMLETKLENMPLGTPHPGPITSSFGYRQNPFGRRSVDRHAGVDLKGNVGDLVKATANGKVIYAGYQSDYGHFVKVQHSNGYETRYAHLLRPKVKAGQRVEAGDVVGLLGTSGRSTGPHIHYEILLNDRKINPEKYFWL
ncbi:M23 family metallopeptidase [Sphingobacterium sp. MYb382]|uniref:M23 family metallopeptidase n=1 Tax=Sphingobacterium sp. MYb382 TaxID=2745278 RepID=UPI0030A663AC